jgi:hypothetical protein
MRIPGLAIEGHLDSHAGRGGRADHRMSKPPTEDMKAKVAAAIDGIQGTGR